MGDQKLPRDPLKREAMAKANVPAGPARLFIHLRVHSAYSLLEGALPVAKIVAHAKADRTPAIAITDTNNLFGAMEFSQKAVKEGIQPIIGCQLDLCFDDEAPAGPRSGGRRGGPELSPVVLIAATETGYANLVRLVSRAYLDTSPSEPTHILANWLRDLSDGIICLTGGERGPIGRALREEHAEV